MKTEAIKAVFGDIGVSNMETPNVKFDITNQSIEYTLKSPVTAGGKEISKLTLTEPTVKQMASENLKFKSDGSFDMEQSIAFITACSGEFRSIIELIKARDALKLTELCACFFG